MNKPCCQYPATYLRLRAQRQRGLSALRLYYIETCGFCGATGEEVSATPPPEKKNARLEPGVKEVEASKPEPKIASTPTIEQSNSQQMVDWLRATTPQVRRWKWRVVNGGAVMKQAALEYAALGWRVFPIFEVIDNGEGGCVCACGEGAQCGRPGKHPRTRDGVNEATTDRVTIEGWWTRWPHANIGIATGRASGILVVDADCSDGKPGMINLTKLAAAHGGLPMTPMVNTGSGGLHLFFLWSEQLKTGQDVIDKAIDVRSDGGYVVAPPSRHYSGKQYEWRNATFEPVTLPDWLAFAKPTANAPEPKQRAKREQTHHTLAEVEAMLACVDPDNRDRWLAVGVILGRTFPEQQPDAWAIYEAWSVRSAKFDQDRNGNVQRMRDMFYERAKDQPRAGGKELTLGSLIKWAREGGWKEGSLALEDFYAYSPMHSYLYRHTRDLWPTTTVNARLRWLMPPNGPSAAEWLDRHRAVEAMTWHPDFPEVAEGMLPFEGGWREQEGTRTFNLYLAPTIIDGDARAAKRWRDHLQAIYPTDSAHIERWLAHRIQRPGEKINHALVLGGTQGIGKDSLLEPVKQGVGAWNWKEISPSAMFGRFNGWVKAVVVRVSEVRDLGEVDRFKFYDHSKSYIAAPPDVLRCDEKNLREHPVFNVAGYIFTTNHKTAGLFLPPDDRRHYVAWSEAEQTDFDSAYWTDFWRWLEDEGGIGAVIAYLRELRLDGPDGFDPKAPPTRTDAWWAIVQANEDSDGADLRSLIAKLGNEKRGHPPTVLQLKELVDIARAEQQSDLLFTLTDRKNRRRVPHLMEASGYVPVRNTASKQGRWQIDGRELTIYGRKDLDLSVRLTAARDLVAGF